MDEFESLNHTKWDCKFHIVFIPKGRKKALFGPVRRDLGGVFRRLAEQKECRILEGHMMPDHVHMLIAIQPKLRGVASGRVHQREKRHLYSADVWRASA